MGILPSKFKTAAKKFKLRETFKLREVVQGAHVHEVLTALLKFQEYFCMVGSMCFNVVENMFGLVAQSGRAPGFYSALFKSEKIPDGRGFKSPRARSFDESVKKEWRALDSSNLEVA